MRMRVNGRIPFFRQVLERAGMIGMRVGHDDCGRPGILPKSSSGCAFDGSRRAGQSRVNQYPAPITTSRKSEEHDVYNSQPFIGEIVGDLVRGSSRDSSVPGARADSLRVICGIPILN